MDLKYALVFCCLFAVSYTKNIPTAEPSTEAESGAVCNPHPNIKAAQYIVGYGSLMETASKDRTYPGTGDNIPVEINGFSREWNLKGDGAGPDSTYLGVVQLENSTFNGVIFQMPASENAVDSITSYDKREHFYCRQKVDWKDITILSQKKDNETNTTPKNPTEGDYWIYINKKQFTERPTKQYPIAQSYVDVFLSGCLELEEKYNLTDFANKCVDSTKGWSAEHWVNDRIFPRRPFVYQKKAGKIDKVLESRLPKEFNNIQIE